MSVPASNVSEPLDDEADGDPAAAESVGRHGRVSWRGRGLFLLIVSSTLLSANALVCVTVGHFLGLPGWAAWQVFPGLLTIAFVAATVLGFRYSNPPLRTVYAVSAAWLGLLNFATFAAGACWVVAALVGALGWPVQLSAIGAFFFGLALLAGVYGLVNAAWLRITRVTAALPHLPTAWQGRSIALVTDLHLGHLSGPGFLRRILTRLRALQPEAVLISGDMFDGPTVDLDRLVAEWSGYTAPRGVFYVTGNHDEFSARMIYLRAVRRTGIRILDNEAVAVDGLKIVGVHDSEAGDPEELRRILRAAQLERHEPSILLAHQPRHLRIAEEEGISLQLSGHTHGGQMWPWSLVVSRIFGRFAYGLSRLDNLLVYTSSGAGTWGPPVRVGTRSEIVLIRLESLAE